LTRYIIRRLLGAIPTLFICSLLIYAILLAAPGGPTARFAQNPKITPEALAVFEHKWGLDQPWYVQYCRWLGVCNPDRDGPETLLSNAGWPNLLPAFAGGGNSGVLHLDFGYSSSTGAPVSDVIGQRIPRTAILAGCALVLWLSLALITGMIAAVRRYTKIDNAITIFNYIGYSFPTFWLGLLLIIVFVMQLGWFPAGGMWDARLDQNPNFYFGSNEYWAFAAQHPIEVLLDLGKHLVLPVATLVVVSVAGDSRFVRASMIDALREDYVRTARAKGVPERRVVYRHALRNAMLPVVTNMGLELPFLFTGAIATETIFSWPGMGREFYEATGAYDYPVLMGILVITAVLVIGANLLADIIYAVVDPRISYG
jgi:peptide/nickel transport system permease protein